LIIVMMLHPSRSKLLAMPVVPHLSGECHHRQRVQCFQSPESVVVEKEVESSLPMRMPQRNLGAVP
jgi:hypothetical protein